MTAIVGVVTLLVGDARRAGADLGVDQRQDRGCVVHRRVRSRLRSARGGADTGAAATSDGDGGNLEQRAEAEGAMEQCDIQRPKEWIVTMQIRCRAGESLESACVDPPC